MCNACGFLCCAYDGFSGCGCDFCDEPACWPDDDEDDLAGDDFDFDCACRSTPAMLVCEPVSPREGS